MNHVGIMYDWLCLLLTRRLSYKIWNEDILWSKHNFYGEDLSLILQKSILEFLKYFLTRIEGEDK